MPIWKSRDTKTSDDHPMAHAKHLLYAWDLAERREGEAYLFKIWAHRHNQADITVLSNQVDQMAKHAAKTASLWKRQTGNINGIIGTDNPLETCVDIIKLQQKDLVLNQLLKTGKNKS
ncbi:unnamed protein product [Caretta caretta]